MSNERILTQAATVLLRRSGYTWAGRDRRRVDASQCAFERRMVVVPARGKSRRRV
jgi:hypothetical protein